MTKDHSAVYEVPGYHRDLFAEQKTKAIDKTGAEGDKKAAGFSGGFLPELFHTLYAAAPSPIKKPAPGAAVRKRIHDLVQALPEFETLRKQTVRDPLWSTMATGALGSSVTKALPERTSLPDADAANRILEGLQSLKQEGVNVPEDLLAKAEGTAAGQAFATAEQAIDDLGDTALRTALRAGIEEAGQQIADAEAAMTALGYGTGTGANTFRNPAVAVELARRVASSQTLKKIIAVAGRLTATARAKRASRTNYARGEYVGVEPTGSLARILPSEMVHLASPLGTALLHRKLMEKAALGYSVRGKEKAAKGPIVICIDQSGSMDGDKNIWAKAVALALLDAARHEKRAFAIVLYDTLVGQVLDCPHPDRVDPSHILTMLSSFTGGGTSFGPPMNFALNTIKKSPIFNKADIVHLTDGEADSTGGKAFKKACAEVGCTVYGIAIGTPGHSLQYWSDSVTVINDVSRDTAAVDTIFDNIG